MQYYWYMIHSWDQLPTVSLWEAKFGRSYRNGPDDSKLAITTDICTASESKIRKLTACLFSGVEDDSTLTRSKASPTPRKPRRVLLFWSASEPAVSAVFCFFFVFFPATTSYHSMTSLETLRKHSWSSSGSPPLKCAKRVTKPYSMLVW